MNQRIRELAEQQGLTGPNYLISSQELEKFAESIVGECANIGDMKEQGYSQYDPDTGVGWYMKQHFGFK